MMLLVLGLSLVTLLSSGVALDNGLALTPPMGWLTWLGFGCNVNCTESPKKCISEGLIKRTADRMVSDGYLAAGYEYVIIDDCWLEKKRGPDGRLVPDRERFKSGMRALSDYVHSKGLKFGMYEDYGTRTCAGYPGVEGHEKIDAETFAEWKIDYLKVDGCNSDVRKFDINYPAFGKQLNETGRPIVYSCSWPAYQEYDKIRPNYAAIAKTCNLWRNWVDIEASWGSILAILNWYGDNQDRFQPYAGPGHWNDPDMLVVGHKELNINQARAQMAAWTVLAAPLIMSVDLDIIRPEYREILLDKDIIAVNKDNLGQQGRRVYKSPSLDIWVRPLSSDRFVVLFLAKTAQIYEGTYNFSDLQIADARYEIQDLFKEEPPRVLNVSESFPVKIENVPGAKFYMFITKDKGCAL